MGSFERVVESVFFVLGHVRDRFSQEWRRGANQRTIFLSILLGLASLAIYTKWVAPHVNFPLNTLVAIPEGMSLDALGSKLEEEHVVQNDAVLRLVVTMLGKATQVKAGDYIFKEPATVFDVARRITNGAYGLEPERIRIHEGATVVEMADIFSRRLPRFDAHRFVALAKPHEGFLFPDTYFFLPNATADVVLDAMRDNFDTHIQTLAGEIASFGKPLSDVVTMASLIEREARISKDRRMISGVLWNRIEKNMLLQVDAAFLYTMGKATFDLTLEDLKTDDPYNTYKYKGLPPTPIGSPSLDSIRAAVTPEEHNYIFYLADNAGTTYYSRTYEEHLRKKRLYLGT
jgi:UPF0755 protein